MGKQNFLHLNVVVLKACSMYPLKSGANNLEKTTDFAYKAINIISLYLVAIPNIYEVALGGKTGITSYSLNIVNTCIYVCSILTVHFFHFRGEVARSLLLELNQMFKFKSDGSLSDRDMGPSNNMTRKITLGFSTLTLCAGVIMGVVPFLTNSEERILPITGVYPFNYQDSSLYWVVYFAQMYAQLLMGALTGAGDSFFVCMVLTAAAQFELLAYDFHDCLYNTLLEYGISKDRVLSFKDTVQKISSLKRTFSSKEIVNSSSNTSSYKMTSDDPVFDTVNSESFRAKLNQTFIGHIKHHQELLEFCAKMESFFWPFILMKTSVSMFYNIFITFALVTSNDGSLAVTLAQYELCAVTEIFIYAIAGQALITKSENLRELLYSSPWYLCSKDYKFLMYMVLMRSGRAVKVSVGKLYDMSHATFLMIMRTAMSYLAVLRQVTN